MVEEFCHADGVIPLVDRLGQTVILANVLEEDHFLSQLPEGVVVGHPLIEVDRPVPVILQNHQWRVHLVGVENG